MYTSMWKYFVRVQRKNGQHTTKKYNTLLAGGTTVMCVHECSEIISENNRLYLPINSVKDNVVGMHAILDGIHTHIRKKKCLRLRWEQNKLCI